MSTKAKRLPYIIRVGMARKRLFISAALGLITILVPPATLITRMLIGWDVGVLIYLVATTVLMTQCSSASAMQSNAAAQDEGGFAILILSVTAGLASLIAIFAELADIARTDPHYGIYVTLAIGTVVVSWTFIHTIFALHYAHEFYGTGEHKNGLRFPGEAAPDYWDFIYFSFVVGMTFQVSDVAVMHKMVRRIVVAHGALSFFFTTAVVAMAVNIAASIIQK